MGQLCDSRNSWDCLELEFRRTVPSFRNFSESMIYSWKTLYIPSKWISIVPAGLSIPKMLIPAVDDKVFTVDQKETLKNIFPYLYYKKGICLFLIICHIWWSGLCQTYGRKDTVTRYRMIHQYVASCKVWYRITQIQVRTSLCRFYAYPENLIKGPRDFFIA